MRDNSLLVLGSLVFCAFSSACSSSSSDGGLGIGSESGGAGGTGGSSQSGGAAGNVSSAGGAVAGGSGGGGGGDAGGMGGSGSMVAPIDPIVVGNAWTYDVTELGTYPLCPSGSHTGTALSKGPKDGKNDAVAVQSLCANAGVVYYSVVGDVVQYDNGGTWVLALDSPVQDGHGWSDGVIDYTWHDAGSVTVPAGTFSDCFSASADLGDAYTIFCRGVGPVHWHLQDASGNGYDAVLTAKNF